MKKYSFNHRKKYLKMDIPHLTTILSSTFDPNLREEAEKTLNEVRFENCKLIFFSWIDRSISSTSTLSDICDGFYLTFFFLIPK